MKAYSSVDQCTVHALETVEDMPFMVNAQLKHNVGNARYD